MTRAKLTTPKTLKIQCTAGGHAGASGIPVYVCLHRDRNVHLREPIHRSNCEQSRGDSPPAAADPMLPDSVPTPVSSLLRDIVMAFYRLGLLKTRFSRGLAYDISMVDKQVS